MQMGQRNLFFVLLFLFLGEKVSTILNKEHHLPKVGLYWSYSSMPHKRYCYSWWAWFNMHSYFSQLINDFLKSKLFQLMHLAWLNAVFVVTLCPCWYQYYASSASPSYIAASTNLDLETKRKLGAAVFSE